MTICYDFEEEYRNRIVYDGVPQGTCKPFVDMIWNTFIGDGTIVGIESIKVTGEGKIIDATLQHGGSVKMADIRELENNVGEMTNDGKFKKLRCVWIAPFIGKNERFGTPEVKQIVSFVVETAK